MLEIADSRDIENEAAASTVIAEENNEQPVTPAGVLTAITTPTS